MTRICRVQGWSKPRMAAQPGRTSISSQHADNLIDVHFLDENTGWIVGGKKESVMPHHKPGYETHPQYAQLKPVVLKTTDGGTTWVNKAAGVAGFDCGEWGWKIQWLDAMTGFVSLENFTTAAILKTTDGGETWVRLPIVDSAGKSINTDLEGVGFIDAQSGWVGGWANAFEGLFNSLTVDGGKTWIAQDNTPGNSPRVRGSRSTGTGFWVARFRRDIAVGRKFTNATLAAHLK